MKSNRNVLNGLLIFGGLVLVLSLLHAQELVTRTVKPASIKPLPLTATDIHGFSTYSDKELAAVLGLLVQTPAIAPEDLPSGGNFQSLQHPDWPFLPGNVRNVPAWKISGPNARAGYYLLDDLDFDETAVKAARSKAFGLAEFDSEDGGGMMSYARVYASNELWLEIRWEDLTNQIAHLTAHNTTNGVFYQILTKTNLTQPEWDLANLFTDVYGTNQVDIDDVPTGTNDVMFFRAQQSDTRVYIYSGQDAVEPSSGVPGTNGIFNVYSEGASSTVTVYYRVSGTASNGVDFTNLTGSISVPGNSSAEIDVNPIQDNLVEGIESVVVTLIQTNSYLIHPEAAVATNYIYDSSTTVSLTTTTNVAVEPDGPPGVPATVGAFMVSRSDFRGLDTNLDVYYQVSGTASNGVDYTFLNGVVHLAAGIDATNLFVAPLADTVLEGMETVTVSLLPTNSYVMTTNQTGTVTIIDTSTTVSIHAGEAATEPNPASTTPGHTGYFEVDRTDSRTMNTNALTVYYQVGGLAINNVDYTNLSGYITIAPGDDYALIYIEPKPDTLIEGDESVILTLLTTNGYYLDTNYLSAKINLHDNLATNTFVPVVTDLNEPVGIDWQPTINSLVLSDNERGNGSPFNFKRLYTNTAPSNVTIETNWSGVHDVTNEVKLATVKTTAAGFTSGDIYFSSGDGIGWLSADGSVSNLNWCVLTNATMTNALPLRGSLYVDQTGVFSNNLIVVTSGDTDETTGRGVWRVDAQTNRTLVASITTKHLEGVVTLPNNVTNWGPWAGKIITGDEDFLDQNNLPKPLIYTIDANGSVTNFDTGLLIPDGIHPEDFDIIPTNQDLYICDFFNNSIMKLPASNFTNHVDQLLITDAGEVTGEASLFIVRWDNATTNFITRKIKYKRADGTTGLFEHVTFAPVNLPNP
jgi:hypothetical protein